MIVDHGTSPVGTDPRSACIDSTKRTDPKIWNSGVGLNYYIGGTRAYDANSQYSNFSTILPPNSPSCMAGGDSRILQSASSYHAGGANCAKYDGSVQFVSDTINAVTAGVTPTIKTTGISDFGIWGALGSVNGGESTTL